MKVSTLLTSGVCTLIMTLSCGAQPTTYQMTYGGANEDLLRSACATNDAGCIMAGTTSNFGSGGYDVYLIKADYAGVIQWTKTYGNGGYDDARSVCTTADGGYAVAGIAMNGSKMFVIRTDWMGDTLWTRTYGGASQDEANCIRQTSDGGFVIFGSSRSFGDGINYDSYLLKIDASGNIQWGKSFGRSGNDYGISGQQTSDGGYMMVGTDSMGGGYGGILMIKTDSLGNLEWTKTYGGIGDDFGYGGIQTSDGGYLITGETSSFGAAWDALLIKTDSAGNIQWSRNFGGTNHDKGIVVAELADGNYAWAGTREYTAVPTNANMFLVKLDTNGDTLWTRTYGTGEYEDLQTMSVAPDGGFFLGSFPTGTVLPDFYLIKTDSLGFSGCNEMSGTSTFSSPAAIITLQTTTPGSAYMYQSFTYTPGSGGTVTSMCLTLDVVRTEPSGSVLLYPNPVVSTSTLIIPADASLAEMYLTIYDISGRVVKVQRVQSHHISINHADFSSGMYAYEISNNAGYHAMENFIVE